MDNLKRLLIIDCNAVIHRAYHALPPLTTKKGEIINAVYGFLLVFLKTVRELDPAFIAAVFDYPAPTFRHKEYRDYKANRPPTPEGLISQMSKTKEILNSFNIPIYVKEGYEADDIIGTIARTVTEKERSGTEVVILSGDLDTLQLVSPFVKVYFLRKGVKDTFLYDEALVKEKYQGLDIRQLVDLRALRGDPSDNIPGVRGIGEKTAIALIRNFGNLDDLYRALENNYEKAAEIKQSVKEMLFNQKEQAFMSRSLASIDRNVEIEFDLGKCEWQKTYDRQSAAKALEAFEFYSLISKLPDFKI